MKVFKFLLLFLLLSSLLYGQEISGTWSGILRFSGAQLRLNFNVTPSSNGYTATMDSPDQGATGIVVTTTTFQDSIVKFEVAGAGISYEGKLSSGDSIPGTFRQGGHEIPLTLSRSNGEIAKPLRPQEPVKPYPYYAEDVHFVNKKGNFALAGTLTMPARTGVFPAVILITGSGPQNRDEEILSHKPFLVIADYLTRHGIAVLRYDDRGTYESKGDFSAATSMDFSTDAEAALDFLLTRKEIDKHKIGLIGHSEGGMIAPMVAVRRSEVGFIVLLAGPGISGEQILLLQQGLIEKASGESEDAIRDVTVNNKGAYDLVAASKNLDTLKTRLAMYYTDRLKVDAVFARNAGADKGNFISAQVQQLATPWMQYFIQFDPAPTLEKVKCPVLALDGSKDLQVPPEIDLTAIKTALEKGGNKEVTTVEFPNLNHLFQECKTGSPSEYGRIEQTFSPVALDEMTKWIISTVKNR
jgi:pimeloyl-ACP methyl ester carboxylesterase